MPLATVPALVPPLGRAAAPASESASRCPSDLLTALRRAVRQRGDWDQTSRRVARALRRHLPGPEILTAAERKGDPSAYQQHLMHAEPDGSFSVVGLVWRPGQITPIHDHVTWCVIGVLQGTEYEELFALREGGTVLAEVARGHPPGPQPRRRSRDLAARVRRGHLPAGFQRPADLRPAGAHRPGPLTRPSTASGSRAGGGLP